MEFMLIGYGLSLIIWGCSEFYFNFQDWKNDYYRDKDILMKKESLTHSFYRWMN